jgi:hypothetical protein
VTKENMMSVPTALPGADPSTSGLAPTRPQTTDTDPDGRHPRRRGLIIGLSVLAGFLLTVAWSAEFADSTIGDTVANTMLGHDAKQTPITGVAAGIVFAFVGGLAGTFTACNIAVFSAVAPMVGGAGSRWQRLAQALRPLGWLCAGMVAVSAVYGAIVGLVGTRMPQFSMAPNVAGSVTPRLLQAMVVFGVIGLVMLYLGLAALGVVRDPFARVVGRFPNAPTVFMGVLIGAFLIGRPFPLFRQMFRDAAESGNPAYGAAAFTLQSLGNMAVMGILFLLIAAFAGPRLQRLVNARPQLIAAVTASAFLVAGTFLVLYWDVRLLAVVKIIPWYPLAPWV